MQKRRVTLADIAREAGVSLPTVSKVLNARGDVATDTREHVERIIATSGYQRAQSRPPTPEPATIEVMFNAMVSPWANLILKGVQIEAQRNNSVVVVGDCEGKLHPEAAWTDSVLRRNPLGVVMVFSEPTKKQRAQLESRGIPCVLVDPVAEESGLPAVGSLNFQGGRLATNHLIDLGHRRIATISGPESTLSARMRVAGYADALARAGIEADPGLIGHGAFDVDSAFEATVQLMNQAEPPTAIFSGSDLHAVGTYQAAHHLGLRIPDDLSVVGYDDTYLADWLTPRLTAVRQPLAEMGAMATRMLFQLSRNEPLTARQLHLDVELMVRGSTAHP